MAKGFGATYGVDSNDKVVTPVSIAAPVLFSLVMRSYRNGAGGGNLGRYIDRAGIIVYNNSTNLTFLRVWSTNHETKFTSPSLNVWTHIGITYDGNSASNIARCWYDGVEQTAASSTAGTGTLNTGSSATRIGNQNAGGREWDGMHADVAWFDRLLTEPEIQAMHRGWSPLLFRPVVYVPMNEASASAAVDWVGGPCTVTGTAAAQHPQGIIVPQRRRVVRAPSSLIAVDAASLTIIGQAPSIAESLPVARANLTLTGQTPDVITATAVPVGKADLAVAGAAPMLAETIPAAPATLSIAGQTPSLADSIPAAPASLTLAGAAVTFAEAIPVGAASLLIAGAAPALLDALPVGKADLALTGFAPNPTSDQLIDVGKTDLVIAGEAPTLLATVPVGAGSIIIAGSAPDVASGLAIGTADLAINGSAPSLAETWPVGAAALAIVGSAPSLLTVIPGFAAEIVIAGFAPTIETTLPIAKSDLLLNVFAPSVSGASDTVAVGAASLLMTGGALALESSLALRIRDDTERPDFVIATTRPRMSGRTTNRPSSLA